MIPELLTPIETLVRLKLFDPNGKAKPNTRILKRLEDKELLPRVRYNGRVIRYELKYVDKLMSRIINEGLRI